MHKRLTISLLLLTAFAACSSSTGWQGTIEVVDGVVFVTNPATPLWETDASGEPRLSLELEQVFGADTAPIDAILGEPYELYAAADAAGNLYVLDAQSHRLVSFAPDGSVRWRVGRKGEGPGEFEWAGEIAVTPDGSVFVLNRSRTRLDRWDSGGSYISSLTLAESPLSLADLAYPRLHGFAQPSHLVLSGLLQGHTGSRIVVVDLAVPAVLADFEWNQLPDIEMPFAVASTVPVRGERDVVLAGSSAGHQFRIYSEDGSIQRHVSRQVDYPVRSGFFGDERGAGITSYGEILAPMHLDPDYLLVCVTWIPGVDDPDRVDDRRFLMVCRST